MVDVTLFILAMALAFTPFLVTLIVGTVVTHHFGVRKLTPIGLAAISIAVQALVHGPWIKLVAAITT